MDEAQQMYDRLWAEALASFEDGRVTTDPYLLDRAADTRRGISLVVRPDPAVAGRIAAFLDEMRAVAPQQHYYRPDELHITVLSLIGTGPGFDLDAAPVDAYRAVFADLFRQVAPFTVACQGITASRDCVMVRGYVSGGALDALRDRLRVVLPQAGLPGTLDRRYRIVTAHLTVMRFQTQPENLPALARFLRSSHDRDFGTFDVEHIDFVVNDWFMSHDKTSILARYTLEDGV